MGGVRTAERAVDSVLFFCFIGRMVFVFPFCYNWGIMIWIVVVDCLFEWV